MSTEQTMDVEQAAEAQHQSEKEVEDLSTVDVGLDDDMALTYIARERFGMATAYQTLYVRKQCLESSVKANKNMGNEKGAKQFESELENLTLQVQHVLRSIKTIDQMYPNAKKKMKELIEIDIKKAGR